MRKYLSLIICLSLLIGFARIVTGEDLRGTSWGMQRNEVILSEDNLPTWDSPEYLLYRSPLENDQPISILREKGIFLFQEIRYNFHQNKLVSAEQWFFPPILNNPNFEHEALYSHLVSWLEEEYGEGEYQEVWKSQSKEERSLNLIFLGELTLRTIWVTKNTQITLQQEGAEHLGTRYIKTVIYYREI